VKALQDVVIVRRLPQKELSDGGIYLVRSDDFLEDIGEVVAVGPGKLSTKGVFIPTSVKKGDRVLFSTNGHQVTKIDGEEMIITRENSLMAVV
jgi:chaperonin GroES